MLFGQYPHGGHILPAKLDAVQHVEIVIHKKASYHNLKTIIIEQLTTLRFKDPGQCILGME